MGRGEHTFREIMTQTDAWKTALDEVFFRREEIERLFFYNNYEEIIFTGCGSAHYLSKTAAAMWQEMTGVRALAFPASDMVLFPRSSIVAGKPSLLVAISRSGETTETIQAVKVFKKHGGKNVLVITCYENSSLTGDASLILVSREGKEVSIAQTRSLSSMLLIVMALAEIFVDGVDYSQQLKRLPAIGDGLIKKYGKLPEKLGRNKVFKKFFFLGSGHLYGLACEAMLKMKEMSLSYSEAFHFLEFRHGPKALIDSESLVIGLLSTPARREELAVISEMRGLGAKALVLAEEKEENLEVDYPVSLSSGLLDFARAILYLPVLHLLAYHKALANGLNPDTPAHLDMVVRL